MLSCAIVPPFSQLGHILRIILILSLTSQTYASIGELLWQGEDFLFRVSAVLPSFHHHSLKRGPKEVVLE